MRPSSFILKKIAIIDSTLNKLNDKVYTIPILSLISLFIIILTIKKGYYNAWGDSESYISAGGEAFNVFRTPIYPNLIYFSKLIFGERFYLSVVVIFQLIVFNISAIYMIKLGNILQFNKSVIFLIFMMYTCSIYVIYTIQYILTESLGISMSVFFVYYLIENLNKHSLKSLCILIPYNFNNDFSKTRYFLY